MSRLSLPEARVIVGQDWLSDDDLLELIDQINDLQIAVLEEVMTT